METDWTRERTVEEFIAFCHVRKAVGETQEFIAERYGINPYYISKILNDPDYVIPLEIRQACNIRIRRRDKRVIIYKGSDMRRMATKLEKLTNGEYTIIKKGWCYDE